MTKEVKTKQEIEETTTPLAKTENVLPFAGSPLTFMRRFTEEMDKVFTDFGWGGSLAPMLGFVERELAPAMWSPKVEFEERNGQFIARADLPGINRNEIHVELEKDAMVIKGERKQVSSEEKDGYYRTECNYGSFYRRLPLPAQADTANASAVYRDGVLEITMPLTKVEPNVKRLEVKIEEMPKVKAAKQ